VGGLPHTDMRNRHTQFTAGQPRKPLTAAHKPISRVLLPRAALSNRLTRSDSPEPPLRRDQHVPGKLGRFSCSRCNLPTPPSLRRDTTPLEDSDARRTGRALIGLMGVRAGQRSGFSQQGFCDCGSPPLSEAVTTVGAAEELDDYDIADGGKYIVTVKSNDVLQSTVDDFSKHFGVMPERIFSSLGMFSAALNLEQVR
jgi:hypothetical protein